MLMRDSTKQHDLTGSSKEIKTLSVAQCGQIASFYRRAVQNNKGDIDSIIQAIYAIPHHLGANNENAEEYHRFCPKELDSWCPYQLAILSGQPLPNHPNYLSQNCVDLVLNLFVDFQLDTESFIAKIASGMTSNNNEAIHSMLFRMIVKTECCGMDVMRFASALAVIRFNDGFAGIKQLYEALGITVTERMIENFRKMDLERVRRSLKIISEQRLRYKKKQDRGRTLKKQIEKHGEGYSSGKYTTAKKLFTDESSDSEEDDITREPDPVSTISQISSSEIPTHSRDVTSLIAGPSQNISISIPLTADQSSTQTVEDSCYMCGGTDSNGYVGFGTRMRFRKGTIDWVNCSKCNKWFHVFCLGLEKSDIPEEDWFCETC